MIDTFIFSATAGKKEDTMLYNTCKDEGIDVFIKEHNQESLQKTYNKAIDFAIKERVENLVLVHDDVILEAFSEKRIERNFGVFLVIKRKVFKKIRFDETCPSKWHFYDLDYSMQCHKAGFKVGVGDFIITHKSPGLTDFTEEFQKGEDWFLDKWKSA